MPTSRASSPATAVAAEGRRSRSPVTDHDVYLFREGTHCTLYEKLGCQLTAEGAHFAVWAPNADGVSVIGDFNGWDAEATPMAPRHDSSGIWEAFVPGVTAGAGYKYRIRTRDGHGLDKADPFAFHAQVPPDTASRAWALDYQWSDGEWMANRSARNGLAAPMSTYEVHLGSWRRRVGSLL